MEAGAADPALGIRLRLPATADRASLLAHRIELHLFERGYGKHTGFGLFMSREILRMTGLEIRENSVPGSGARFEIIVPEVMCRRSRMDLPIPQ